MRIAVIIIALCVFVIFSIAIVRGWRRWLPWESPNLKPRGAIGLMSGVSVRARRCIRFGCPSRLNGSVCVWRSCSQFQPELKPAVSPT